MTKRVEPLQVSSLYSFLFFLVLFTPLLVFPSLFLLFSPFLSFAPDKVAKELKYSRSHAPPPREDSQFDFIRDTPSPHLRRLPPLHFFVPPRLFVLILTAIMLVVVHWRFTVTRSRGGIPPVAARPAVIPTTPLPAVGVGVGVVTTTTTRTVATPHRPTAAIEYDDPSTCAAHESPY